MYIQTQALQQQALDFKSFQFSNEAFQFLEDVIQFMAKVPSNVLSDRCSHWWHHYSKTVPYLC